MGRACTRYNAWTELNAVGGPGSGSELKGWSVKPIVMVALNARWAHTSFGLRCLLANLGPLRTRARLLELTINERAVDIVEQILAHDPAIVALGAYIWNITLCTEVISLLKQLRPDLPVVLGGPEVSFADDAPAGVEAADWIIAGEAEHAFRQLCEQVLAGQPPQRFIAASPPELTAVQLPYELYDDTDIAHRKIYVEASRGCPFGCELCLSSLDDRVRKVPLPGLLEALAQLWQRGVRHFKFIDRALHLAVGPELLGFFLDRWQPGTFLHFELVPDHLPRHLAEILARFPAGSVQLETGVQTLNAEVSERIGRRLDLDRVQSNLAFLRRETGVYIHADLIVGLPGESLSSLAAGFDRLLALQPHEIQVDLLKRLRGTTLPRHSRQWGMIYSSSPPYEVLQTSLIDFHTMQRLRRLSRYFDLVYNRGSLSQTAQLILTGTGAGSSPFAAFLALSDWLYETTGDTHGLAFNRLARLLHAYLTGPRRLPCDEVAAVIDSDYRQAGRAPIRLREPVPARRRSSRSPQLPERQQRRLSRQIEQGRMPEHGE
jgi:hypothetical protein